MSDKSAIEWTDATWNPVTGCSKVSPGCAHCYAETISLRFGHSKKPWTPENAEENVVLHPERLDQPLRWRSPRMIFVNSMSDLFHEEIPSDFVWRVFDIMRLASQHTFQVLTKRPERAVEVVAAYYRYTTSRNPVDDLEVEYPLPNVWLGVSIENSAFTWRADVLREVPAAVRFISAEPLLGSLFEDSSGGRARSQSAERGHARLHAGGVPDDQGPGMRARTRGPLELTGIDWLIVGGESGGKMARPMDPLWARELRDACLLQGITRADILRGRGRTAFFFKQWGSHGELGDYVGASPKSGGRILDGREWNEMPAAIASSLDLEVA